LTIEWTARIPLSTDPIEFDFGRITPHDARSVELAVVEDGPAFCDQCSIHAAPNDKALSCTIVLSDRQSSAHIPEKAGDQSSTVKHSIGKLHIDMKDSAGEVGSFRAEIKVVHMCKNIEIAQVFVPIKWNVSQLLDVTPHRISLNRIPGDRKAEQVKILISSTTRKSFNVLRLTCDDPGTSVSFKITYINDSHSTASIELSTARPEHPGIWRSTIRIFTDMKECEELTIPISSFDQG
jgi:hypothetical protein